MDPKSLLIWLALGAVAGWLAGTFMKGGGFGLIADIILGILGAVVGGYVFGLLGIELGGIVGSLITATVGAMLLLGIVRLIKHA